MADRFDCLGLGIAPADILMQIAKFPRPGAKIDSLDTVIQGGGPIPTAMVTLARLGFKPALIAKVGNDPFGDFVIEELNREKVVTSYIIKDKKPTAVACGWVEKIEGRRTIALDLRLEVKPSDIVLSKLPDTRLIHLDARDLKACLKLARWGHKKGIPVSLDVGSMRNDVTEIIPQVDHLVCAEEFALPFTSSRSVDRALEKLRRINKKAAIVITSGTAGSKGLDPDGNTNYQRAFRVKTVDTTGAGDTYHGAYLAGVLKGWSLAKRMQFASAAAAMKCRKMGGRSAIPTMPEVKNFLKEKGKR